MAVSAAAAVAAVAGSSAAAAAAGPAAGCSRYLPSGMQAKVTFNMADVLYRSNTSHQTKDRCPVQRHFVLLK